MDETSVAQLDHTTETLIRNYATTYAYGRVDSLAGQFIAPTEASRFARHCVEASVRHGQLCDAFNAFFPGWATKR